MMNLTNKVGVGRLNQNTRMHKGLKLAPSQILEMETQKMEQKLLALKELMNKEHDQRQNEGFKEKKNHEQQVKKYQIVVDNIKSRPQSAYQPKIIQEVHEFLQSINLLQHYDTFLQNGFEEMELINDLNAELLTQMNIPLGHQMKILKKLGSYDITELIHNNQQNQLNQEINVQQVFNFDKSKDLFLQPSKSHLDLVQLDGPNENQILDYEDQCFLEEQDNKLQQEMKNFVGFIQSEEQNYQNSKLDLGDGVFDEEKNRREFQESLLAYRNQKKQVETQNVDVKSNDNKSQPQQELKVVKKIRQQSPIQKIKQVCWSCFQPCDQNKSIKRQNYYFCQQICLDKFQFTLEVKCDQKNCSKLFMKSLGFLRNNQWYCSLKCAPTNKIEQFEINNQSSQQDENDDDIDLGLDTDFNAQFDLNQLEQKYKLQFNK